VMDRNPLEGSVEGGGRVWKLPGMSLILETVKRVGGGQGDAVTRRLRIVERVTYGKKLGNPKWTLPNKNGEYGQAGLGSGRSIL